LKQHKTKKRSSANGTARYIVLNEGVHPASGSFFLERNTGGEHLYEGPPSF